MTKRPTVFDRTKPLPEPLLTGCSDLLDHFINRQKSSLALKRYADLKAFQSWRQTATMDDAISVLLATRQEAHRIAEDFAHAQQEMGRAPKTVYARSCILRQLIKLAQSRGVCDYVLEVKAGAQENIRDTRGPSMIVVRKLLDLAKSHPRNYAILRLFVDMGLRCCEVSDLDIEHVNLARGELWILGKARVAREKLSLPAPTREALSLWIEKRGASSGFLWSNRAKQRLGTRGLYRIIREMGKKIGIKLWPHALRHTAITNALELTDGDVRKVAKFSRHRSLDMLMVYDDARLDAGGEIAALVAKSNSGRKSGKRLTHKELLRELKERLKTLPASETVSECLSLIEGTA
jgi:integrase/recombinase XerC